MQMVSESDTVEVRFLKNEMEKREIMIQKEKRILDILSDGDCSYGMAKSIIQRVEEKWRKTGNAYLPESKASCISSRMD